MHRVLSLGEDWKPLYPRWTALDGRSLLVHFHVPAPPLAWGRPFSGHTAVAPADRGFTVVDDGGVVPIEAVELAGARSVRLTLARPPGPEALLRYADRSRHGGRGALHDSDASIAEDRYAYDPGTGHYPSANVPELVGQPYPLMNWCVAFTQPIGPAPS